MSVRIEVRGSSKYGTYSTVVRQATAEEAIVEAGKITAAMEATFEDPRLADFLVTSGLYMVGVSKGKYQELLKSRYFIRNSERPATDNLLVGEIGGTKVYLDNGE